MTNEWERRETETESAYRAFTLWLSMKRRTVPELAKHGFNTASIARWKKVHQWKRRTVAYDSFMNSPTLRHPIQSLGLVQQDVITAGHGDYIMLRDTWVKLMRRVRDNIDKTDNEDGEGFGVFVGAFSKLINMRLQIEELGRKATKLPRDHGTGSAKDDVDVGRSSIVKLTPTGPEYIDMSDTEPVVLSMDALNASNEDTEEEDYDGTES